MSLLGLGLRKCFLGGWDDFLFLRDSSIVEGMVEKVLLWDFREVVSYLRVRIV